MRSFWFVLAALPLCAPVAARPEPAKPAPVLATVETTLATADSQIRQLAFDGDPDTYFASKQAPTTSDHFTLVFDRPVAFKSVTVTTGRPGGGDALDAGALEVSEDGKKFDLLADFTEGKASGKGEGRKVLAVRIRPTADLKHPLAVRELAIDSEPAVAIFKHPVEYVVDVADAPEMKEWADRVARLCERWYPAICEELWSDGFKPTRVVTMTLKKDYNGVAAASGGRITGSVKYFKAHPDDLGAMIHETVHVVQRYRTRNNPGWLVEGIADYVRFFKYEPGKLPPLNPDRARYNGSYKVTAAFLGFVTDRYDKELVRKLNKAMREGEYREEIWKALTKKTLPELEEEWKASLRK
jgi:hypothetical protein